MRLYPEECPRTVENFTTHCRNGYYDNLIFHRVIRGFMIQTGDPLGDGTGGQSIWGREFEDEFHKRYAWLLILLEYPCTWVSICHALAPEAFDLLTLGKYLCANDLLDSCSWTLITCHQKVLGSSCLKFRILFRMKACFLTATFDHLGLIFNIFLPICNNVTFWVRVRFSKSLWVRKGWLLVVHVWQS